MQMPVTHVDPRIAFWSNPAKWPDDVPPEHIFLGRAVNIMGGVVFGTDWTGREASVELAVPLPEELHAFVQSVDLLRGCRLLFDHHPPYFTRCPSLNVFARLPIPTDCEWARAVEINRQIADRRQAEFNRFNEVCSRLANAFKQGTILTATRDVVGGLMVSQDRWFWNTENFWWRFATCRVDLLAPYHAAPTVIGGDYLFVDQASLNAALQPSEQPVQAPAQPDVTQDEYLSPYLRCMISATRALGITVHDKRKKQDIVVELPKHWSGRQEDLSAEDLERMATLMREPEHKGGRKFKKRV
jgi:hypothetical protein